MCECCLKTSASNADDTLTAALTNYAATYVHALEQTANGVQICHKRRHKVYSYMAVKRKQQK